MADILVLHQIAKHFGKVKALDGVSFSIPEGSIFGLLGPNGAGKTTLIRIITGIFGPDAGTLDYAGGRLSDIGYMPEERGLYKKMKVKEQLKYLVRLKGLNAKDADREINHWMNRFKIEDWANKKIEDLSKGMQQKVQFISTVLHKPKLLILDEPFSGLDPINTNLIRNEIRRLRDSGTTIIFSTHRMEQVEEICEEIVLINHGRMVLTGNMQEIKKDYKESIFYIAADNLPAIIEESGFSILQKGENFLSVRLLEGHSSNELLAMFMAMGISITEFREVLPSLNEIFIREVEASVAITNG